MDKLKTMADFTGAGIIPLLKSIVTVIPEFFSITLFFVFILGTASSYFAILRYTGKKRFWHSLTAMSFSTFLLTLLISGMNTIETTFIQGYWVGFYILMVLLSWFMLVRYK